jgi:Ni,Fe-hydrogenase III small subunit/formate hydrogenlyase subunit 6/NADH:ubiquinone oxidoreductase subunit I
MLEILRKTFRTGLVTISDPIAAFQPAAAYRGTPRFDFRNWTDVQPAAAACPTGAIQTGDAESLRTVTVDYGLCIFCGQCAAADTTGAVTMAREFEPPAVRREQLRLAARYALGPDGRQTALLERPTAAREENDAARLGEAIHRVLGRSLAIREVDAGSCNGCEVEIHALNNPLYDLERYGIHFVASPRHADMLLVTGPVTRNMELALLKTWRATPDPKLVVATGACAISGGIFGRNYAVAGPVEQVIPVDVFIPGCPPRPEALLYGILLAAGRLAAPRRATVSDL